MLADPLLGRWADREPDQGEREALAGLAAHYCSLQLKEVARLSERLGGGPSLRRAGRRLAAGEPLSYTKQRWLSTDAQRDHEARARQEERRAAYLERRDAEARRLAKEQGIAGRLRRRPADFLAEVDRRLLRFCPRCEEIAYPGAEEDLGWTRSGGPARACHFCGEGHLEPYGGAPVKEPKKRAGKPDSGARAYVRPRRGRSTPRPTDDTRQGASGGDMAGHRADDESSSQLGVQRARLVRRSAERDRKARAALRVLYRDFLAGGGLDIARATRCPRRLPHQREDR